MAAAEEILAHVTDAVYGDRCEYCRKMPPPKAVINTTPEAIAAIITQCNADAERVLRVAAEWAAKGGGETGDCPYSLIGPCMKNKDCNGINKFTQEQCWLEYWKKEADSGQ